MEFYGSGKKKYILAATPFKKGGEGSVYEIIGNSNLVAKIYHAKVVTDELEAKIKYINNNPPAQSILNQIAWPQDFLTDSTGKFVGFVMPKLHIDVVLEEIYAYPPKKINISNYQKVVVAINICRVISEIHKAGYTFGDFNPCNIGVNLSNGNVAFLDTDSYHIYDKNAHHMYRCVVCRDGYVAPELIKACKGADYNTAPLPTFTQETDRFALAIHIFKLLFNGFTPYNGILETERSSQASPGRGNEAIEKDSYCFKPGNKPMSSAVPPLEAFPQEIQDLFTRAFIVGRYAASMRPTAEEWDAALVRYLGALVQCGTNPLHHFYNNYGKCPYCEADANYKAMLQSKAVYGTSSQQMSYSQPVAIPSASQSRTGSGNSGSSTTSSAINRGKRNQAKTGFRKKFRIALIIILCVLLAGAGTGGGIYYKISLDKINETTQLISYLPTGQIEDYSLYGDLIFEAYDSYSGLAEWQKEKVENRETLLNIIPAYNEYMVASLRSVAENVTVETVAETDYLASCVEKYNNLTQEQKAMLTDAEVTKFENFITVKNIIDQINEIDDDLLNRYNDVDGVKRLYFSISTQYQPLVYNYNLVDTFDEKVQFYHSFIFTESGEGYTLKAADDKTFEGEISLPDSYNHKPVVGVDASAFKDQHKLTGIIVPDSVTHIGAGAFSGCNRLESITIPFVGESLNANKNLTYIFSVVPQSLKTVTVTSQDRIEDLAFKGCNHIEKVFYRQTIDYVGTSCFEGCELLNTFNSETEGTLCLLGEMEAIGNSAFKGCESIKNIIFSDETLTIGSSAFSGCKNIEALTLTERIRTIGDYAFQGLKKITNIVVHNSTESIGNGAFNGCTSLENITLPFTGASKDAKEAMGVFGYIFGYKTYDQYPGYSIVSGFVNESHNFGGAGTDMVWQYTYNRDGTRWVECWQVWCYYIPKSIRSVTITNQTAVSTAAFNSCDFILDIYYTMGIESQGECAFQNCTAEIHDGSEVE